MYFNQYLSLLGNEEPSARNRQQETRRKEINTSQRRRQNGEQRKREQTLRRRPRRERSRRGPSRVLRPVRQHYRGRAQGAQRGRPSPRVRFHHL